MSEYTRTDLKIKQPDGSFKKYSPTVTVDSVMMNDGTDLSSKFTEDGKLNKDAMPQHIEITTFTLADI